ncbi:arylesterase [Nitrosomonas sp.]|uniref:arylesterase n=1 Tax=Nitrosomonas sp. TaxID=42353 RepID=UPI0037C6C0F3
MKKLLFVILYLSSLFSLSSAWSGTGTNIMVLGDSLSAGYGLPPGAGWVNLLERRLQSQSPDYRVINISISGEITLGGRNRIKQALKDHVPDIVIVALGANDGLQGRSVTSIYENLEAIILTCKRYNVIPLLIGMQLPPNYGISYTQKFRDIYPRLAQDQQLQLAPFLMEGFGDQPELFQADGIHPTIQAQERMLDNVWPALVAVLGSIQVPIVNKESADKTSIEKSLP